MGKHKGIGELNKAAIVLGWLRANRWRWSLPIVALALIATGLLTTGTVNGRKIAAAMADPLAILAARSPGARTPGALTQTKPIKAADMQEHVLSSFNARPGAPGGTPAAAAAPLADAVAPGPAGDVVPAAAAPAAVAEGPAVASAGGGQAPFTGGGVVVPGVFLTPGSGTAGGGGVSAGGGGGGTGGGATGDTSGGVTTPAPTPTATPTPTNPVTPVAAVPEPAAWLTLLFGFGAIGGAMRGRRRAAALRLD